MPTIRVLPIACFLVACLGSASGHAADESRWSVQIGDETVMLRASETTAYKFVRATITALQEAGAEKFTLGLLKPNDKIEDAKLSFTVQIVDGNAEIISAQAVPYKYLQATIKQLGDAGVTGIKISSAR